MSSPTPETCRELADELERHFRAFQGGDAYVESKRLERFLLQEKHLRFAPTIITALRGYADAAGEIERLRGYVSAIHRGILGQEPFENVLADADAERCRHQAITLAAEVKWLRSEVVGLRAENARLSAAAGERWIPVSERLPENINDVMFITNGDGIRVGYYYDPSDKWLCGMCVYKPEEITHWMELPEPPAKESEQPNA